MKLSATALSLASALTAAILWLGCSILVALSPGMMMAMTGQMVHMDVGEMSWSLDWAGFLIGWIVWSALAGICGWLIATSYNRFVTA